MFKKSITPNIWNSKKYYFFYNFSGSKTYCNRLMVNAWLQSKYFNWLNFLSIFYCDLISESKGLKFDINKELKEFSKMYIMLKVSLILCLNCTIANVGCSADRK